MLDVPVLITSRLCLRRIVDADGPAIHTMHSNPHVMRWWSTPPWSGDEPLQRFMARQQCMDEEGDWLRLAIVRRADACFIGTCSVFAIVRPSDRAELGYCLDEAAWGHGYAQEAVGAMLAHAFGPLGLRRIEADIDPRNAPSARLLERLGFRREGLLRQRWVVAGEVSDSALYGLLRDEWREPAAG